MISYFLQRKQFTLFFLLHIALGLVTVISPSVIILWTYAVLLSEINTILIRNGNSSNFTGVIVYLSSLEVISRMVKASPYIPFEMSKYLMIILFILGFLYQGDKAKVGAWMLAMILPSFFINRSGQSWDFQNMVFNGFGIVSIALGVIYFYKKQISYSDFNAILRLCLYPLITALTFTFLKTPEFDQIEFTYTTSHGTTAGFGANQVSTIFGLGAVLTFIFWISKIELSGNRFVDLGLLGLFMLQGILTFSRGGVLGGILGILIMSFGLTIAGKSSKISWLSIAGKLTIGLALGVLSFLFINEISENKLLSRYRGETEDSLEGQKEININTYTSNRYAIFFGDLDLWYQYPVLGTGVGASQSLREFEEEETAAHVELSRLLAEHGLLGFLFFATLCFVGFRSFEFNRIAQYRTIVVTLFLVALYSTFHAALRTYVSPLFLTLSLMHIIPDKPKEPRLNDVR